MAAENMQDFGDIFKTLSPEIVEQFELQQKTRQKQKAEIALKMREKYGFSLSEVDASKVAQAEAENAICEGCKGLPCKKTTSQNRNWQNVIKIDPLLQRINIAVRRCKYAEKIRQQKFIDKNFEFAKLPKKYFGKKFADYQTDKSNIEAFNKAKEFVEKPEQGLLFYGKPGRGKTMLAAIIAQEFLKRGKSVIFGDVPSLLEDLRSNYNKETSRLEEQMAALSKTDLVVLDDIGTEKPTEWAVNRLYLIVNDRYNNNKPLIVTSNYTSQEIEDRLNKPTDTKAEGVTGSRIVSRLLEMCKILTIRGEDRRVRKC